MSRARVLLRSAMSLNSVHWRLTAVLLLGSLIAYVFPLYGQYRDQHDKILEFAQSSHRALTEVVAQRIDSAIRTHDGGEINQAVLDTVRAVGAASRPPEDATGRAGATASTGSFSATLVAFGVFGPDGTAIGAYHSPRRPDVADQIVADLAREAVMNGKTVDRLWSNAHLIARPMLARDGGRQPVGVVAVAWDLSHHFEAADRALLADALRGALATLLVILGLLYVVHRMVTRPIGMLTRHVAQLGVSADLGLVDDALANRRDEIGVLAGEFNKMVEALVDSRQKLQNRSYAHGMAEMASGVLHNIRNALNPISVGIWRLEETARNVVLGRIDTALNELADDTTPIDRRQKLAGYVRAAAEKLVAQQQKLADDIRDLGRHSQHIEQILQDVDLTGRRRRKAEPINLDQLVEECAAMIPAKPDSRVDVEIDSQLARLPSVLGNRIILSQVIGNLLLNAAESIRSTAAAGKIIVTGSRESDEGRDLLHLEVRDDGAGISAETMGSLFQRGFSTKREKKGGIGLHWCANSIIAMGGKIHASSDGPGTGATFHLLLPIASDSRSQDSSRAA